MAAHYRRPPHILRRAMQLKLYVVHGSHPCAAVEKALSLKGLQYSVFEWPPPLHAPMQRLLFGDRTVPALRIGGEKVQGSRAIMRRLDELAPEPPLLPSDPDARARVLEAERWGDEVFQPIARELIWAGFPHNPGAMVSYSKHSRLRLPAPVVRLNAPLLARMGRRLNKTSDATARARLAGLPAQLDTIDGWIADGTIGDAEHPNAADLQIASTIRLMLTFADVRGLIDGRPCATLARKLFPHADGEMPAGAIAAA
jgi:glutathione S-transferase